MKVGPTSDEPAEQPSAGPPAHAASLPASTPIARPAPSALDVVVITQVDPGVIDAVAAGRALDRGLGQLQAARVGAHHGALECARAPVIVDRGPDALELAGCRMVQPGRDEQTVGRELEVGAAAAV